MSINKKAIGFLRHQPSGCYWYRIKQPMDMLKASGIDVTAIELDRDITNFDDMKAVQFYGAYPFSCDRAFRFLRESGKKIVYDMDDPLDLIDMTNPFFYAVKKDLGSMEESMEHADHITVSTPAMKRYVESKCDKPVTVIPNCYTPSEWTYPRPKREGIRIGFAGSATHVKDLIDIIPVIESLQKRYPVTFIIMGFGQADYQTWYKEFRYSAPKEAIDALKELDRRLAKIQFEWVPYIEYTKYPSALINMALDIGICPLKETPFDRCRSACKAMEYTLSGALALASDVEAYRNDDNSVKVKDGEWEEKLAFYIENPDKRKEEHEKHLAWTKEHRNIETQLEALKAIYL